MNKGIYFIILIVVIFLIVISYFAIQEEEVTIQKNNSKEIILINGSQVNIGCEVNNDCKLTVPSKLLECLPCDSFGCKFYDVADEEVLAVSTGWSPECLDDYNPDKTCAACSGGIFSEIYEFSAVCINNICVKQIEESPISFGKI